MTEVFHNDENVAIVGDAWLQFLKQCAQESPLRRSRYCLHHSADDQVHEMIIVMCRDVIFRPHRHRAKSESYHIIEGFLDVILFSDSGTPEHKIEMGPLGSGANFAYRLNISQFHAVLPRSEYVVVHESTSGPFVPGEAEIAPWSPSDIEALRVFLAESAAKATVRNQAPPTQDR